MSPLDGDTTLDNWEDALDPEFEFFETTIASAPLSRHSSVCESDDDAGSGYNETAATEDTERDWRDPLYRIHLNGEMGWGSKVEAGSSNGHHLHTSNKQEIGDGNVNTLNTAAKRRLKQLPPNLEGEIQLEKIPYPKPVLMVDLCSISGSSNLPNGVAREIVEVLNERLYECCDERCETLFEMGSAIHATEDEAVNLVCLPGMRHRTVIPYPPNYEGLDDLWGRVCAPGDIPCVEALLVPLRRCSRSLTWKAEIREEIEMLAIREAQRFDDELITDWQQARRRQKLRRLVATRPVFVQQMAVEEQRAKNGSHEAQAAAKGLAHKIDQIDNLIAELELCEIEDGGEALGSDEDEEFSNSDELENVTQSEQQLGTEEEGENNTEEISIIDAILAMVLGRIASSPGDDSKTHSKMLFNWHNEIRTKWIEEFGKLPMVLP